MAALTGNKPTPKLDESLDAIPVKAATTIFGGALVANDTTGYAVPGSTALGLVARGVAKQKADNSAGASGDIKVVADPGIFKMKNHGADLVVQADNGKDCYIVDDQTVAKTDGTGTRSRAGKVVSVDSDGVFVAIGLKY